jgi:hypothetical protein
VSDAPSVPGSFDIVDLENGELGLSRYPRVPLLPAGQGQEAGGAELPCSQVATVRRLLQETLTMVGRDVPQLARVNLKIGRKKPSLPGFFRECFLCLTPPLFRFFVQCLAQDMIEKAELREEVTVGCHKMHIFTTNIHTFHSRYRR